MLRECKKHGLTEYKLDAYSKGHRCLKCRSENVGLKMLLERGKCCWRKQRNVTCFAQIVMLKFTTRNTRRQERRTSKQLKNIVGYTNGKWSVC
jgi:hypothetical protein